MGRHRQECLCHAQRPKNSEVARPVPKPRFGGSGACRGSSRSSALGTTRSTSERDTGIRAGGVDVGGTDKNVCVTRSGRSIPGWGGLSLSRGLEDWISVLGTTRSTSERDTGILAGGVDVGATDRNVCVTPIARSAAMRLRRQGYPRYFRHLQTGGADVADRRRGRRTQRHGFSPLGN